MSPDNRGNRFEDGDQKIDEELDDETFRSSGSLSSSSCRRSLNFQNIFCGREQEILKLESIFRRTATCRGRKFPPLVLVAGISGAGKSALVSELKEHLSTTEEEFFWISGKFEEGPQQQQEEEDKDGDDPSDNTQSMDNLHPFAAFVDGFSCFCEELEQEEPETLEEVRDDILDALGQQGSLLTNMIPSLSKIIGVQGEARRESDQKQLFFLFKKFIQALAGNVRSVVLVLDDLNRADSASLKLLHALLTSQLKHVMFIGTYRSNEVDEKCEFTKWINSIEDAQAQQPTPEQSTSSITKHPPTAVTRIELSGMDLETINGILSKVLNVQPDNTRSLAYIIYQKTAGNTFFVIQYLLFLNKQNFISYNNTKGRWDWEEPAIQKEAAINTTLLDFIRDKLLSSNVAPKILPVAACIGAKFSREALSMILSGLAKINGLREILPQPDGDILDLLKICEKEGFIENNGNRIYSFVHDKMQEAALAVHPAVTMQQIRYETGTFLYHQFNEKELDENLFLVVKLLNVGRHRNDKVTPFELAQLNLTAAVKAKGLAAFSSAATFIKNALNFVPRHGKDEAHRALVLEVCSLGAEVEAVLGRLDLMEKYSEIVFASDANYSVFEQLRVQNVIMDSIANVGGRAGVALERCIGILEDLDCWIPKSKLCLALRAGVSILKSKSPKNIPNLDDVGTMDLMTDTSKLEAMRLLDRASTYSYEEANVLSFSVCTTRMARWTIRYGLCDRSPPAFALLAMVLMHSLGDYKAGTMYAELAVAMMEKLQAIATERQDQTLMKSRSRTTFVAYGFVLSWVRPVQEYKNELVDGYHLGMREGDIESAHWNYFNDIGIKFAAGRPLKDLLELCRIGESEMHALQREMPEIFLRIHWQGLLNLVSTCEGKTALTGSALKEEEVHSTIEEWDSKVIPGYYDNMKTMLFTFYGEYEEGAKLGVERGDNLLTGSPGGPWALVDPFFRGICLYAAAGRTNKRLYRRHAQKVRGTLQSWVKKGNPTALHQLQLLDAEHKACMGTSDGARELYESACTSAMAGGFTYAAALANLRYAEFLFSLNTNDDMKEGRERILKAISLLERWGAQAVVVSLRERYPDEPNTLSFNDSKKICATTVRWMAR